MLSLLDNHLDPYWNLAAEEYLLTRIDEPFFRLWQNSDSVIVGRHQNTWAEVNVDYVKNHNIPVVRRMTGGGAVFHDSGNINYSFFNLKGDSFTRIITDALSKLGLNAKVSGRNDITADGFKISGTAVVKHNGRILEHGTLLFDASLDRLSEILNPRPEKFAGKKINSVRARVANIKELIGSDMNVTDFKETIFRFISSDSTMFNFSDKDIQEIDLLNRDKYSTDKWNFGKNPDCQFTRVAKFDSGLIETHISVEKGVITAAKIYGDYFSDLDTDRLCGKLIGIQHTPKKTIDLLRREQVESYLGGITPEEFLPLLF